MWRLGPPPGGNLDTKVDKVDSKHWEINHNQDFAITDPVPTETILDINWCFAIILLKVDISNSGTSGSIFVQVLNPLTFCEGLTHWYFFDLFF